MNTENAPLISLLTALIPLILAFLSKNAGLVARGINNQVDKAQQTAGGNGIGGVAAVALESQTQASRLLIQRVDGFERETIRRLDEILLSQSERGRQYEERFTRIEETQASQARRIYNLEHPPTPTETPIA